MALRRFLRGRKLVDMFPKSDSICTYSRQKLGHLLFVREGEEEESVSARDEEVRTPASISFDAEDLEMTMKEGHKGVSHKTET